MSAILWTLILYLLLGTSFFGWGVIVTRVLRVNRRFPGFALGEVWLGLAVSLLLLQVVHLFLPLTGYVVMPLFALGIGTSAVTMVSRYQRRPGPLRISLSNASIAAIVVCVALWIATRSVVQPPDLYDSGLYHFQAVRWIESYPIVLGLGNLHGRLAFNSSLFSLVAALDFHPYFNHGHALANNFTLTLAFAIVLFSFLPYLRRPASLLRDHPIRVLPSLFALPVLGYFALDSNLAAPGTDFLSAVLQIVLFLMICRITADWREGKDLNHFQVLVVLSLALTVMTVKLSNLAFAVAIAGLVGVLLIRQDSGMKRSLGKVIVPPTLIVLVWTLRGYLLSGAPLYPSLIGSIPVEWAVPRESIVEMSRSVYSWARSPGADWIEVLGNRAWLRPWLEVAARQTIQFVYPVAAGLFAALATIGLLLARRRPLGSLGSWGLMIPPALGFGFWFALAPAFRFLGAQLFLLVIAACMILLEFLQPLLTKRAYAFAIFAVLMAGSGHYFLYAYENKWLIKPCFTKGAWVGCLPYETWQPINDAPLELRETTSGLKVYIPVEDDRCWDGPLPCTPQFNENLRLREPGQLSSGFVLEGSGE